MAALVLDASRSRVRIRTLAEGLFARLAHDLELVAGGLTGSADTDSMTATLVVPIGRIEVAGTVSGGKLDPRGLSASDREDCLRKMRRDVFYSAQDSTPDEVIRVEATVEEPQKQPRTGQARARVRLLTPNGIPFERSVSLALASAGEGGGGTRVSGNFEVSLQGIGSLRVTGPMHAFRVKDGVLVQFELVFNQPA